MNLVHALRTVQFFSAEEKSDANKLLDSFKSCKEFNNENITDPSPLGYLELCSKRQNRYTEHPVKDRASYKRCGRSSI